MEWLLLAVAAPTLMFPGGFTWLGMCLLITTWLARRAATGAWGVRTRIDRPAVVLIAALLVSLIPSIHLDYSLPKFWGIVLGLTALYACVNLPRTPRVVRQAECSLLVAGALIAVVGALGMMQPPNKLLDQHVYAVLPRLITSVQSSTIVSQGIHPNELAGTLVLLIPLSTVLLVRSDHQRWLALAACVLMLIALVLSQSRAALLGLAVAACVGMLGAYLRRGVATSRRAVLLCLTLIVGGLGAISVRLLQGQSSATNLDSLPGRVELWKSGLAMALDMPLTGIGLNTFPLVLQAYYPTILDAPFSLIPHAHDFYLQTLLDLGLPGLAAFLVIVTAAAGAGIRVAFRSSPSQDPGTIAQPLPARHLVIGLLLGLVAHGVFSVGDAVTLGAKPGLLLWIALGLLLLLGQARVSAARPLDTAASRVFRRRLVWALCAVLMGPVWLSAASLNGALVLLHRSEAPSSRVLSAGLQLASVLAPDPLAARVASARSLDAELRGDLPAAIDALDQAWARGSWDHSLALRLANLRAAAGDRDGAIEAWRSAGAINPLLARANASSPDEQLEWLGIAIAVDPTDPRPSIQAASVLQQTNPVQAAAYIAQALSARGDDPARHGVARRLTDPLAPLPPQLGAPASPEDAHLFAFASRLMLARNDLPGSLVAARLATMSDPQQEADWTTLATALDRAGWHTQADQARVQAALGH